MVWPITDDLRQLELSPERVPPRCDGPPCERPPSLGNLFALDERRWPEEGVLWQTDWPKWGVYWQLERCAARSSKHSRAPIRGGRTPAGSPPIHSSSRLRGLRLNALPALWPTS